MGGQRRQKKVRQLRRERPEESTVRTLYLKGLRRGALKSKRSGQRRLGREEHGMGGEVSALQKL